MKRIAALLLLIFSLFSVQALDKPEIAGKTAVTIDVETNELIFTKNIDRKMYPASTTKLITAILLARNKSKEDSLFYSPAAKASYPYKLNLPEGT